MVGIPGDGLDWQSEWQQRRLAPSGLVRGHVDPLQLHLPRLLIWPFFVTQPSRWTSLADDEQHG